MARSTKFSESPSPFGHDMYEASPAPRSRAAQRNSNVDISPSPSVSISSDKENRSARPVDKGKGRAPMGPPSVPVAGSGKRRRTVERGELPARSRRRRTVEANEDEEGIAAYNPDQDIEERRRLRKGLRDLNKNLIENRTDLLNPNSTVLKDTLHEADNYAEQIKQTSDATIDSRLLVTTADLSYKKTLALISGDTSQGVDVDEFISKCMSFMRSAEGAIEEDGPRAAATPAPSSTQRRRTQRNNNVGEDGDEDDDGDMLNWEHLGRFACLPNNSRPSIPGFLLGPLSLEKRARKVVVRKAPLRQNNLEETRPEVLEARDIHKDENANLTTLCTKILTRLEKVLRDAQKAVDEQGEDDMSEAQIQELMDRYGVSPTGGLALFKFVINPHSFGQTIENIFYVSFLVRDGKVGLSTDDRGMPYLEPTIPRTKAEIEEEGAHKHQSVIALDMAQWEELIELFEIKEPMIKHREEEEHNAVGAKGWYA